MKGTSEGIILFLDDRCDFESLLLELKEKVTTDVSTNTTTVTVNCQNRFITKEDQENIKAIIQDNSHLKVKSVESNVLTKKEANEWLDSITVKTFVKTIRSGQVLKVDGDALIVGDVNPGATVNATGNIFVLGKLKGIVHAGFPENPDAVVVAAHMNPSQIRIADKISRAPDYEVEGSEREFAFINEENYQIELGEVHNLQKIRPNLVEITERGF